MEDKWKAIATCGVSARGALIAGLTGEAGPAVACIIGGAIIIWVFADF